MTDHSHSYHHRDLRSALVAAGMDIAEQDGVEALGLREITRRVGVTPNAAYRHFSDLRTLVLSVALEAQHRLARAILHDLAAVAATTDVGERGRDRLRAFGLAYIGFARSAPGWFDLTCLSQEVPPTDDVAADESDQVPPPHLILLDILDDLARTGMLSPAQRSDAEWPCWSAIHGFAQLCVHGPLQGLDPAAARQLADRVLTTLLDGLVREPSITLTPRPND